MKYLYMKRIVYGKGGKDAGAYVSQMVLLPDT